jgi:hypothetical protein
MENSITAVLIVSTLPTMDRLKCYGTTPQEKMIWNHLIISVFKQTNMEETNDYVLIQSKKLAEIKYKALQKRSANLEKPLSEASIEATAVIEVINYIYENNEWFDIHNRSKYRNALSTITDRQPVT